MLLRQFLSSKYIFQQTVLVLKTRLIYNTLDEYNSLYMFYMKN